MKKIIIITIMSLSILSCGKKGSLEYPSDDTQTSFIDINSIHYS